MMNPEIKASWVEALRSEEYKQGANALHGRHVLLPRCALRPRREGRRRDKRDSKTTIVYYRSVKDTKTPTATCCRRR
jgi:hypothetical protein